MDELAIYHPIREVMFHKAACKVMHDFMNNCDMLLNRILNHFHSHPPELKYVTSHPKTNNKLPKMNFEISIAVKAHPITHSSI